MYTKYLYHNLLDKYYIKKYLGSALAINIHFNYFLLVLVFFRFTVMIIFFLVKKLKIKYNGFLIQQLNRFENPWFL